MTIATSNPVIDGVGAALGSTTVSSAQIEERLGLSPGWIEQRTGIHQRPYASPDEATSDLAVTAATRALEDAGIDPGEVRLLLLATSTPDHPLPPTAPAVAERIGAFGAGAIDLAGACSGFCYALVLGDTYVRAWGGPVLIVAANVLSRRLDHDDPATAALFADGAGAAVLAPSTVEAGHDGVNERGIRGISLSADGSMADAIMVPAGGSREPMTADALAAGQHLMRMHRGPALFHAAARAMAEAGEAALKSAGTTVDEVDLWVPHQAGSRLMHEAGTLLQIPPERTMDVVATTGNSSAATIPIALAAAKEQGRLKRGDDVLLTAVGAGLVGAGVMLRW